MNAQSWTRELLAVILIPLIISCANQITSEVTRFHRATEPTSETIAIVPGDEAKRGSIEFSVYAARVAKKLTRLGYKVVDSGEPELIAKMDYSVGPAQTRVKSWSSNYVHYHFYHGRIYPYYYGMYWDEPRDYAYTVYPRSLNLDIMRPDGEMIFEGQVKSIGREDNINEVMPYLIEALFQNFPGESGVTKVVTIRKDDEPSY